MDGPWLAAATGALLVGGCGLIFVWLGRRMIAGRLHPNMGHHNVENTTPDSWRAAQLAIGNAVIGCGWLWVIGGIVFVVFAPAGVAMIAVASLVLIIQSWRASRLLEPVAT